MGVWGQSGLRLGAHPPPCFHLLTPAAALAPLCPAAVLLWGAARLGYAPAPSLLDKLQQQAAAVLRHRPGDPDSFSPQVAGAPAGLPRAPVGTAHLGVAAVQT